MFNFISTGNNTYVNTTNAAFVLGTGANQTAPPALLMQSLTVGGTVTLPKIAAGFPSAPGTPGTTPSVSDGYPITIRNLAAFPTTIVAASGDTLDTLAPVINGIGNSITLIADVPNTTWREIAPLARTTIRTVGAASTLAPTDKFLIVATAGTVTLQSVSTYQIGEIYTVSDTSAGSVTLTPTGSTSIQTQAAATITTLTAYRLLTDGVQWYSV